MNARMRHGSATPFLFLAPAMIVLGVFFLVAIVQVGWLSLTNVTAFRAPEFVGLENYQRAIAGTDLWVTLLNSAAYLLVTPVVIVLSLWAALILDARLPASRLFRLLFFLPVITPTIVAAIAWRVLLREDGGLFNTGLEALGFEPIRWLTERPWTLVSAMLVTIWKGIGFYMMIFLAALTAIPRDLKEAAALDGAGTVGQTIYVVLPAIWPSVVLVALVSSIAALKVFDELFVTVRGTPIDHQTVVPLIYQTWVQGDQGLASAYGIILFVVILAFSLVNLRLSSRGGRD